MEKAAGSPLFFFSYTCISIYLSSVKITYNLHLRSTKKKHQEFDTRDSQEVTSGPCQGCLPSGHRARKRLGCRELKGFGHLISTKKWTLVSSLVSWGRDSRYLISYFWQLKTYIWFLHLCCTESVSLRICFAVIILKSDNWLSRLRLYHPKGKISQESVVAQW